MTQEETIDHLRRLVDLYRSAQAALVNKDYSKWSRLNGQIAEEEFKAHEDKPIDRFKELREKERKMTLAMGEFVIEFNKVVGS